MFGVVVGGELWPWCCHICTFVARKMSSENLFCQLILPLILFKAPAEILKILQYLLCLCVLSCFLKAALPQFPCAKVSSEIKLHIGNSSHISSTAAQNTPANCCRFFQLETRTWEGGHQNTDTGSWVRLWWLCEQQQTAASETYQRGGDACLVSVSFNFQVDFPPHEANQTAHASINSLIKYCSSWQRAADMLI